MGREHPPGPVPASLAHCAFLAASTAVVSTWHVAVPSPGPSVVSGNVWLDAMVQTDVKDCASIETSESEHILELGELFIG